MNFNIYAVGGVGPTGYTGYTGWTGPGGGGGGGGLNGVNTQSGTSYSVVSGDNGKLIVLTNAGQVAVTLPNASSLSSSFVCWFEYLGTNLATITPTGCNYDNANAMYLSNNQGIAAWGDGANFWTERGVGIGQTAVVENQGVPVQIAYDTIEINGVVISSQLGTVVGVNGTASPNPVNLNDTTPVAPTNGENVKWQKDTNNPLNVSAYVPSMIFNFDTPRTTPNAYDDEFNSTVLNAKWSVVENTQAVLSINSYLPSSIYASFTGNQSYAISQSFVPGSGATDITVAVSYYGPNDYQSVGFWVGDTTGSAPTNSVGMFMQHNVSPSITTYWRVASSDNNTGGNMGLTLQQSMAKIYLHMQKTAGGVWSSWYSYTGGGWLQQNSNINSSYNPTVNYLTLFMAAFSASTAFTASIDWVRVNWLVLP
jgi:hypothetical protein